MGTSHDIPAMLDQFNRDHAYIVAHRSEWLKRLPEHWVLVHGEQLVGSGITLEEALEEASLKCEPRNAAAVFITDEPQNMLL